MTNQCRLSQMGEKPSKFQSSDFNPAFVGLGEDQGLFNEGWYQVTFRDGAGSLFASGFNAAIELASRLSIGVMGDAQHAVEKRNKFALA